MTFKILNLTNFQCPDTLVMLKKNIKNIHFNITILILTNDISTKWDIPLFCQFMNYNLLYKNVTNKPYYFCIQKNKKS